MHEVQLTWASGGHDGGGGSDCSFVSVSQNVFPLGVEKVDETFHLFGQLGFTRDKGEVPIMVD
jgi:hypothetical protein